MSMVDPDRERYAAYTCTVNVREYIDSEPEELTQILNSYGYNSVADVIERYGHTANQIIAECIFEYYNIHKGETLFTGSRNKCEQYIKNFVGSEG